MSDPDFGSESPIGFDIVGAANPHNSTRPHNHSCNYVLSFMMRLCVCVDGCLRACWWVYVFMLVKVCACVYVCMFVCACVCCGVTRRACLCMIPVCVFDGMYVLHALMLSDCAYVLFMSISGHTTHKHMIARTSDHALLYTTHTKTLHTNSIALHHKHYEIPHRT